MPRINPIVPTVLVVFACVMSFVAGFACSRDMERSTYARAVADYRAKRDGYLQALTNLEKAVPELRDKR